MTAYKLFFHAVIVSWGLHALAGYAQAHGHPTALFAAQIVEELADALSVSAAVYILLCGLEDGHDRRKASRWRKVKP